MKHVQLAFFDDIITTEPDLKAARSGSFVDNMSLPVHRWFRYSAGFAAQWVEQVLDGWQISPGQTILDPFAGSGTVAVVCDAVGHSSLAVEAHPFVARICQTKLQWPTPIDKFADFTSNVAERARSNDCDVTEYPDLIRRSYDPDPLSTLHRLKTAWIELADGTPESELAWLALTAILRPTSTAGTAQWQYILPNKTKKNVQTPESAFLRQVEVMKADMRWMQARADESQAVVILNDARTLASTVAPVVDAVITSPPYANNYDYADALRFEMTFWGEVESWGDIHDKVRKHLMVSSSQHASREKYELDELLSDDALSAIRQDVEPVVRKLALVREDRGGKKHYHTMVAAYARDISIVLQQLRQVCRNGSQMCWVIGDSAPYGVYCPIDRWIGELAIAAGFKEYSFEKLRDRNTKWKNRKHRVPLKEGLLWIMG